jgi:hypothetical protein
MINPRMEIDSKNAAINREKITIFELLKSTYLQKNAMNDRHSA